MACIRCSLSKFVAKTQFNLIQTAEFFFRKKGPYQWHTFRGNKLFLTAFSLWGIIRKETTKPNTTEQILHNVALAAIAFKDGNLQKSGNMLLKTLDLAETNNFSMGVISACDLLSSLAVKFGDYERAENLLIKALENLVSQGVPEDDSYVISFNLKLSRIYSNIGNDELAEIGFKNCLDQQQKKLKNKLDKEAFLVWTTILYWYGKFLLRKNRFLEAKFCFKDCYSSSLKVEYFLPNQIMVILYNLGEVCEILGEHDEATEYFLSGVSLDKKHRNPDLTYFYSKLGAISLSKGLYREAKLWCDKAQKFAVKHKNQDGVRESNKCLEKLNAVFVT